MSEVQTDTKSYSKKDLEKFLVASNEWEKNK